MTETEQAYEQGYAAGRDGKALAENPYPERERETTCGDELHYQWFSGYLDGEKDADFG